MPSRQKTGKMKNVTVEPLTEGDIQDVVAIESKSFPEPWSASQFEKELHSRISKYYKATLNGKLVGYAGVLFITDEAHITTIAVDETMRRQGLGKLLMCKLINLAIERDAGSITLEVRTSNEAARKMYRRFGFTVVGERKGYYASSNEDAYIMDSPYLRSEKYLRRLKEIGC